MPTISFNPGPAQVYPIVAQAMQDAYQEGILSLPHRSKDFQQMVVRCRQLMQQKLRLPTNYQLLFLSSATECWEVIAQSLIGQHSSHLFNGSFGERWYTYTQSIHPESIALPFGLNDLPHSQMAAIPRETELIALTHNETSNTTCLPQSLIATLPQQYPNSLIAVDATSSMAGVQLQWQIADVWFASVQKCFGLPAGLAVMCLSPRAVERVHQLDEKGRYNSLSLLLAKIEQNQTSYTPNVLGIYLLMRVLEHIPDIGSIESQLQERAQQWYKWIDAHPSWQTLIQNPALRSTTVIGMQASPEQIEALKTHAQRQGVRLGNGYGPWKAHSIRIANFPAIPDAHFSFLRELFHSFAPAS